MKKNTFWQAIFFITAILGRAFFVNTAIADDEIINLNKYYFINLDKATIAKGYTVQAFDFAIKLSLIPGILDEDTGVDVVELHENMPEPWQFDRVSELYQFEFRNKAAYDNEKPYIIQMKYSDNSTDLKQVYYYDKNFYSWRPLPTKDYVGEQMVRAYIHLPFARIAVFSNQEVMGSGRASWYAYKNGNFAASPDFPKDSILRVTNLENKKFVDVEINDYGPDRKLHPSRVIDLDKAAFTKIAKLGEGVIDVSIEPLYIAPEQGRVLGVSERGISDFPEIKSQAGILINLSTEEIIWSKDADIIMPLASLTKLVTAVVFLDLNIDMEQIITYKKEDEEKNWEYVNKYESAKLQVKDGDLLKVKDALYSTLIASTNNTAETLVRISGLSRAEFISRMNNMMREWGAKSTYFVEPSGLSPNNVSTAADYAIISKEALKNPILLEATTLKEYKFTYNSGGIEKEKKIINTNKLLWEDFYVLGGKTGYLDKLYLMTKIRTDLSSDKSGAETSGDELLAILFAADTMSQCVMEMGDLLRYGERRVNSE